MSAPVFTLHQQTVPPGGRATIDIPLPALYTRNQLSMPVHVVHGKIAGPRLLVSSALHGDEINGVEIIRRLLKGPCLDDLTGTLICVPIVNVYGFIDKSRYLPDRRDLNRSFPGSPNGSIASRLANVFVESLLKKADAVIDLHSAAIHRDNFPQIRSTADNEPLQRLATAFDAPIQKHSNLLDHSLRATAHGLNIPLIVYEAGEALRFDEMSTAIGVRGIRNVMRDLGMLSTKQHPDTRHGSQTIKKSKWLRAPISGIFRSRKQLGDWVQKGDTLGHVADPLGQYEHPLLAPFNGLIIGKSNLPLLYQGEALLHLGQSDTPLYSE